MTYIAIGYTLGAATVAAGIITGYAVVTLVGVGLLFATMHAAGSEE